MTISQSMWGIEPMPQPNRYGVMRTPKMKGFPIRGFRTKEESEIALSQMQNAEMLRVYEYAGVGF